MTVRCTGRFGRCGGGLGGGGGCGGGGGGGVGGGGGGGGGLGAERWRRHPDGRTRREQTKEARLCAGGRRRTSGRSGRGTRGRGAEGGEGVGHYQRTRRELVQGGGAAAAGGGRRASGGRPDHPAAGEDPLQVRRRDRVAKRGHEDVA